MSAERVTRAHLPHTFGPWFTRFEGLREIQERGIPPILSGQDTLLASATASGKTEAFAAPAAEMVIAAGRPSAAVLIVSPTRALANDLRRRLEGPMALVNVGFGRYTGEHKETLDGRLPSVLVTTPEALDSLLARRSAALREVRLIVLDEIHVLDKSGRGDQLRVLLHRLERVALTRPQRVLASATLDRPEELAQRYLVNPSLVTVPGTRRILGKRFEGRGLADMAKHLDELAGAGLKKLLVFCRSRNDVEFFSAKLRGETRFGEYIFAHHGSMAKQRRERTEQQFQRAPAGACFATLTLEMGIDIGTVDYVLLAGLPSGVDSLLQRIGRGGRRGDQTRAGYVVDTPAEGHRFEVMFRLGKAGELCGGPYAFRPAVLVQQTLVLACAQGSLTVEELSQELPSGIWSQFAGDAPLKLLEGCTKIGALERLKGPSWVPTEQTLQRYDRGTLHSCIEDTAGRAVIDRLTGDVLGHVDRFDDSHIGIAGSARQIVHSQGERVLTDRSPGAEPARFASRGAPPVTFALARATVEALGVPPGHLAYVATAGGYRLLHGLGTVGTGLLIDQLRALPGFRSPTGATPFTLTFTAPPPTPLRFSPLRYDAYLHDQADNLSEIFGPGPRADCLPPDWLYTSAQSGLGLPELAEFLSRAQISALSHSNPLLEDILRDL